jgi:hypothetical protein
VRADYLLHAIFRSFLRKVPLRPRMLALYEVTRCTAYLRLWGVRLILSQIEFCQRIIGGSLLCILFLPLLLDSRGSF